MLPFGKPGADPEGYAKVLKEHMSGVDRGHDSDGNKDYLFTREWTRIQTVDEATTFVKKIWNLTTVAERKYIYAVYRGRSTAAAAVDVIKERIRDAQAHVDDLERTREEESQSQEIKDKVKDACMKKYGVPNYSQTELFKKQMTDIMAALSEKGRQLVWHDMGLIVFQ